jgi:hypothetical protein
MSCQYVSKNSCQLRLLLPSPLACEGLEMSLGKNRHFLPNISVLGTLISRFRLFRIPRMI